MPYYIYMLEENTSLALLVVPVGNIILPKAKGCLSQKRRLLVCCVQGNARKKDIMFPNKLANNLYVYGHVIFMNKEKGLREQTPHY